MASLVLGVLEVAYSDTVNGKTEPKTTGDVAEILETKYHVMQTFFDLRKGVIGNLLADSMGRSLQDLFNGRKTPNPGADAQQQIEAQFRSFLDANEMQKLALALGAPISAAALRGNNKRKLHPYAKKNRARPAFIDSGNYRMAFRAEIRL